MAHELSVQNGVRTLLSNVSLSVSQGDIWQLAGGNGVGKTSLLRAFARLARIEVFGRLERCEDVLYSGHSAALKGALTPRQNLMTHPSGLNVPSDLAIDTALEAVGVLGHADVQTARLSAGQKRRIGLARLALAKRHLWLLDEPSTALDAAATALLAKHITAHCAAGGMALIATHTDLPLDAETLTLAPPSAKTADPFLEGAFV